MFLISLSIHMTSIFILCLIHVLFNRNNLTEVKKRTLSLLQVSRFARPYSLQVSVVVSLVTICLICILVIPIFGLTGFHIVLVSRGRTTNEQVTGKFRGGYNPFSKNCCHNICNTLCGPVYPRYCLGGVIWSSR
jgi:palmitoyltransferase